MSGRLPGFEDEPTDPPAAPVAGFAAFWEAYPRHVDRKKAERAWTRLRPSGAVQAQMLEALSWQTRQRSWQAVDGEFPYVPYPASYLNGARWNDPRPPRFAKPADDGYDWYEECGRIHSHACGLESNRHRIQMDIDRDREIARRTGTYPGTPRS